jgi:hypothetical protein
MSTQDDSGLTPARMAMDRLGVSVSDVMAATKMARRTVYKCINGDPVSTMMVARFLGYAGLTDAERVAIIEHRGLVPMVSLGVVVGVGADARQPMTTILRGGA